MRFVLNGARNVRAWIGTFALAAAVAACGGGSDGNDFQPTRLVVFGDQNSVIDDSGACIAGSAGNGCKYTINAVKASNTAQVDCAANPIWVQVLAQTYGFAFAECNPNAVAAPQGLIFAANGARATDLAAQVDAFLTTRTFTGTDLVTVLVGHNDIMAQYTAYLAGTRTTAEINALNATLVTAGETVAAQVDRIARAGGKVLIATVPDMGDTPFAVDPTNTAPVTPAVRSAQLRSFTDVFNNALRLKLAELNNDGHMIGLVLGNEVVDDMVANPGSYGLNNIIGAACTVALPNCTANTGDLQAGATATTWLWADSQHITPVGHARLGAAAQTRALNNPF